MPGLDPPQKDIAVGDRQRPAPAVTGRAGIGAGRIRADVVALAVEVQDGTAAGRHRVNPHHRGAHAHACDHGFEGPFVFAVEMRNIRGRAPHIEADNLFKAAHGRGLDHPDDAPRRAGKDTVLALKHLGVGQPAVGLHELKPGAE